jgi:hypothetical protein
MRFAVAELLGACGNKYFRKKAGFRKIELAEIEATPSAASKRLRAAVAKCI